jgi:hypothetical protein
VGALVRISVGNAVGIQDGIANTDTDRDVVGELLRMDVDDGESPLLGVAVGAFVVFSGRVCGAVKSVRCR